MLIDTTSGEYDYTYLSLGAGVQSSALLVLACTDDRVPKPDVAIFADTGDEPPWVYEYVKTLADWAKPYGVEVVTAQKGVLSEWVIDRQKQGKRFVTVPIYTASPDGSREGMLRRQCTREFKVDPITNKVRELLGYKPRQRVKHKARAMLGITIDEAQRMKPSWHKWITNCWPLIDLGMNRQDCYPILEAAGLPEPQKSACVYCPYHSDAYWQWMKDEHPDQFQRAVDFDEAVRDMTMRGTEQPGYLHRSCVPLSEAVFRTDDPNQLAMFDMGGECEGMCGV
jgi:hypothetical protein